MKGILRKFGRCVYCGARCIESVCQAHRDLPDKEPAALVCEPREETA